MTHRKSKQANDFDGPAALTMHNSLRGLGYTTISHSACVDERLDAELLGAFTYVWHRLTYHGGLTEQDLVNRFGERVATRFLHCLEEFGYATESDDGLAILETSTQRAVLL